VVITAFADKSFTFIMKTPPATVLIKKAIGIARREAPSRMTNKVGTLTRAQCEAIATQKDARPDRRRSWTLPSVPSPAAPGPWASPWRESEMAALSKRQKAVKGKVDAVAPDVCRRRRAEAGAKNTRRAKFDESIDVAVGLGVDPRKSDQIVRGSVVLPAGTGKTIRVAVFAQGDKAVAARQGGRGRHRRFRGPRRRDQGGRHQFRSGHRHPRRDARRRSARPDPGSRAA
jgi:hypothetical protein